ncbi:MAG: hypothetical protein MJ180_05075 [Candidatus Gastranaerophilales bacterium]|nr:hypothetical protein [Candidatus Gastranaerophilales bacterium]
MKKIFLLISILILCCSIKPAFALYGHYDEFDENYRDEETEMPLIIPAGSFFRAMLGQDVSSEFNNNGDVIKLMVNSDYSIDNKVLIPKYAMFIGVVRNLEKAQRGRDGYFSIDIIGILFPDGRKFDVKGCIYASKNDKVFGGGFARRAGHKSVLHRATTYGHMGAMQLMQNGPRIMGKETKVQMGEVLNVYINEPVRIK